MNRQMSIFDGIALTKIDKSRLKNEGNKIYNLMMDNKWRTKSEISEQTGLSTFTITSHLTIFKKTLKDSHVLNSRLRTQDQSTHEYQLLDFSEPLKLT